MSSSYSSFPPNARSPQELGQMLVGSTLELKHKMVMAGHNLIVLHSHRVAIVELAANQNCKS